ncbi:Long-chain-fatty-acid--AMP ligase FadD32 [Linum perenne]
MDPTVPIDDQFSKLHPSLPLDTRICVLGGGPSGISAVYALAKLGYRNITVLEKHHTVGGLCESVDIEGRVYDLGGQVLAKNSAPVIFHLAKEAGSELEEMDSHKLALIDSSTGKYQDNQVADDYVSVISLTLGLQDKAKATGRIGVHAVSELASDLTPTYLESHGLKTVPKSVAYGYTASGYGFVQDMPYAYIHEFTRTSMAGKIRRFKDGYTSLWKKLSESLPIEIHCQAEVQAIRRDSNAVRVDVKRSNSGVETLEFDKIIVSGSFPFRTGKTYRSPITHSSASEDEVMDLSDLEKELFSKVQTIDYYTTVVKIKGLEDMPVGFYYFGEFMEDPATIGHPVALQKYYADSDIFLFWSYGNSADIMGPTVTGLALKVVESMGAKAEQVVLQRRFKYFPHVSSQDMKNGFYEKLEVELQGEKNTFYVGGLMAFELTERNSSYSMALICKHFANCNPLPMFPYVKSLFSLQSDIQTRSLQFPREIPGVEFPDLPSLDAYLKHWGTLTSTREKILYSWINEEGGVVCQRTYSELNDNAASIAHKLLTSRKPVIKPGDRVMLVHVPGLDFVDAFFGCLRARVIPVPVIPPDPMQRGGQVLLKIENIAKSCKAVAILSTSFYHTAVRAGSVKLLITLAGKNENVSGRWPNLPWCHTDSWVKNSKTILPGDKSVSDSEPKPQDLCFLQFTSGSTGDAKGVIITHGGLIHNVKMMRRVYKSTSNTVLISWLPQYHDMGLIGGLFTALVSGGTAVLFSPLTFIKNPLLWLQTMTRYRATHSAGPNFSFELMVRRLEASDKTQSFDLSSMVFLMIAAEPVRQKTLKRFIELTRPFGLSQEVMAPGYGLAENCVFVSCAYGERKPILIDWQGRVSCGYVNPNDEDIDIKIVDPKSGEELKGYGKEGEIWISSPSAGTGYWGREELSQKTFKNELMSNPRRMYTRTGDLGRIIDGSLFITGRIKDLIIVAGRNIYSADVEKTVENSSEILRPGCCAVIGVPEDVLLAEGFSVPDGSIDQVGLVVIAEVREIKQIDKDVVAEQIKVRIAEEHGVTVAAVKLIKPRTLSKTTSGKIKRFECLKQFTEGSLSVVPDPTFSKRKSLKSIRKEEISPLSQRVSSAKLSNEDIVEFLKKIVSEQTGVPIKSISTTKTLVSYGIDSIGVVRAAQKLSDFLGISVGAIDILSATCIADLGTFSENLLMKSQPQVVMNNSQSCISYANFDSAELLIEVSKTRQIFIWFFQLLAIAYISTLLSFPAYLSISAFTSILPNANILLEGPWLSFSIHLALAPLAWILCMVSTSITITLFGKPFLQPNYALTPEVSIWSIDFVKWWALYKVQETASKVLAIHLRGTVFLNYWFGMLGAQVGSSVLLDSVDITDPSLVSIGDGVVIAEGALVQSHEVKNEVLSFLPIKIGRNSSIGPYSMIHKGSIVGEQIDVPPLQRVQNGIPASKTNKKKSKFHSYSSLKNATAHFVGVYMVGLLSSFSAAIVYFMYIWLSQEQASLQYFSFFCICGAFHWIPFTIIAYATMLSNIHQSSAVAFAVSLAASYLVHGLILIVLTAIVTRSLAGKEGNHLKNWLRHRLIVSCHLKFAKLLSGTEAFCVYLRLLGAKIGRHCSIRAINAVSDPKLIRIGNGVHLGDFSRIVPGYYSSSGYISETVEIQDNSVTGSQSIILPGVVIQNNVILGALSVAPTNYTLQRGGIYVGSQSPIMIKNTMHSLDDRIQEMDTTYKKIVGNLAAGLAATTLKIKSRYFHRIGVSAKGQLKIYNNIKGLPYHNIFQCGKTYPVIIRHSNSLSFDDDARIDTKGAALRILSDDNNSQFSKQLLDLTLQTGNAFYARTIADFATWLVCGLPAREAYVKRAPHIRDAVWSSLRNSNSYTEHHYYSNSARLLRCQDGQEMYVRFKLRPADENFGEDVGKVEPIGILPPETGTIPRDPSDSRPLLFLAEDFQRRVSSSDGVHYIFQLQVRPVPKDEADREDAIDSTKPWDATKFPNIDVGEITLNQNLSSKESESLQFKPDVRCKEVDVIPATSSTQSASIEHGRSVIYEICQHLRNGDPLPEAWRILIEQSDVKVDLSGCPMAAVIMDTKKDPKKVTLARTWHQTTWATLVQPFLQTLGPYFLIGLIISLPLNSVLSFNKPQFLHYFLPIIWLSSGFLSAIVCIIAKWVLVGTKEEGQTVYLWSISVFMDTVWQVIRTIAGDYFIEMICGSIWFNLWVKLLGTEIELGGGSYIDSMGTTLNPEMVEIERGGCIGKEALLFGHIYEGQDGKVKFGKISVGEGGFIGSRAIAMPGVRIESGGSLEALSLAMKEEIVRPSY